MSTGPRTPPRFVPTLTAVVDPSAAGADPLPTPSTSPELVKVAPAAIPTAVGGLPAAMRIQALSDADAFRIEEELLHRVLQRVDASLEERVTDAVSAAVQQQLDAMLPRLREEIETVLRTLVSEALAQELSENTGSPLGSRP